MAIAQAAHLTGRYKGQLINGLFGAQLLHDADEGIPEHDAEKAHVQPRAHERQHDGQYQKNKVEVGTDIVPHDLTGGLGLGAGRLIRLARCAARFDLGSGQPVIRWHVGGSFRVIGWVVGAAHVRSAAFP